MANANDPLDWLSEAGTAIRAMLPTNRHAEMLFDTVRALLGDHAYLETANQGGHRWLFRRDPTQPQWLIPWPLMQLSVGPGSQPGTLPILVNGQPPEYVPPPRPRGKIPALEGLGPANVKVYDGADSVEILYCEDGRSVECFVGTSGRPRPPLTEPVAKGQGNVVEQLADRVVGLDLRRLGPARALIPVPLPGGPAGVWRCGLAALREALWAHRVPEGAAWVAVDGVAGTALGSGATKEAALEAWQAEVRRLRPKPPPPAKAPDLTPELQEQLESGEAIVLRGPASDVAMPALTPETTPAVLVPLPPAPRPVCPLRARWVRLVGETGAVSYAAMRRDLQGFTLVGETLLDQVDATELDAQLDAVDQAEDGRFHQEMMQRPIPGRPPLDCQVVHYRPSQGKRPPWAIDASSGSRGFQAGSLDGDRIRSQVARQRWRQP